MGPRNLGWPVDRGLGTQYLRGPLIDHPERRPREADWLHCLKNFYAYCVCVCVCAYTLPAQGIISYSSSSRRHSILNTRDPPLPSPFIYRDRRRNIVVVVVVVVSRMFSREKRNGEGEDSIHKF